MAVENRNFNGKDGMAMTFPITLSYTVELADADNTRQDCDLGRFQLRGCKCQVGV